MTWNGGAKGGTTRILNNVLIADRDSAYSRGPVAAGQAERNPALHWDGITTAQMEHNVIVVNVSSAPSRQAWYNGNPCAFHQPEAPACTWDFADNFLRANSVLADNVYFNATSPATLSHTFPGSCESTPLGACKASGGRSEYNHGCACASLTQWTKAGEDTGSLSINPELEGPLRLVTSPKALALGIDPLHELATVGPDWKLEP